MPARRSSGGGKEERGSVRRKASLYKERVGTKSEADLDGMCKIVVKTTTINYSMTMEHLLRMIIT
jgi:hypothetical protein